MSTQLNHPIFDEWLSVSREAELLKSQRESALREIEHVGPGPSEELSQETAAACWRASELLLGALAELQHIEHAAREDASSLASAVADRTPS